MLKKLLAAMAAIVMAGAAFAAEILPREPAIEGTIQQQFDAFQVDDFAKAFTYASPNIKRIFGSSERFGSMVRGGYPMVWRHEESRFLELRNIDGRLYQKVMVRDAKGSLHVLDYQMIQTENGWKINGVQLLRRPDVGA